MCASTTAKVGAVGWFLTLVVAVPYVGSRYPGLFPEWLPSWFFIAVIAVGFVGGGFLLKGLDSWRWHRLATSMGLEPTADTALARVTPVGGYRGEFDGRAVTLEFIGGGTAESRNWTRVKTPHDGDTVGTIRIRRKGLGGVPDSELPPSVDLKDGPLAEQFDVHAEDAARAREVLSGHVRDLLVDAEAVDEVIVDQDTVVSKQRLQPFDPDVIRTHMQVATGVSDAVETATGR